MNYMNEAIIEAKKALKIGEIPVGAIIVKDGEIIGRGFNNRENENKATGHAEIVAIENANRNTNNWRLNGSTMYVTLEPCIMCMGAIINARIQTVVYAVIDQDSGACGSVINILGNYNLNKTTNAVYKHDDSCEKILSDFFKSIRKK